MFHLLLDPPYSTPSILLPYQVTLDGSVPRRSLNMTSGGLDFLCSLTTLLLAVPFANRTKPVHTL